MEKLGIEGKYNRDNQDKIIIDGVALSPDELDYTFLGNNSERIKNKKEYLMDKIISQLICEQVTEVLKDELSELEVEESVLAELEDIIKSYSVEDRLKILSFPAEIRPRVFSANLNILKTLGPKDFVKKLFDLANDNGLGMGYHLSNADIQSTPDNRWDITGYEMDDRDDRPMAYYSEDWLSRYKDKGIRYKFLYMVRSDKSERTSHKVDLNNKWGRADRLSIIEKFNLDELSEEAEDIYNQFIEEKEEKLNES